MRCLHYVCAHRRSYADPKAGTIGRHLGLVKPTVFFGVPLVWEKMADKIKAISASSTGLKRTISDWAKGKALKHAKNLVIGGIGAVLGNYCFAKRFLNLVKGVAGLDK